MKSSTSKLSSSVVSPSVELPAVVDSGRHMQRSASRLAGYLRPRAVKFTGLYVAAMAATLMASAPAVAQTAQFGVGVITLGGGFDHPNAVALDSSGNVYVADSNNNAVKKISLSCINGANNASCVTTLGGSFNNPWGVAVDSIGNVYVGEYATPGAVKEIPLTCINGANNSGCVVSLGGGFNHAAGVAVDGSGNVYVADEYNGAVKKIPLTCINGANDATCVQSLGGGYSGIIGVAVDSSGNVYTADFGSNQVKEIPLTCINGANNASCVTVLANGNGGSPFGVAVDTSGNVYEANYLGNSVQEIPLSCINGANDASCVVTIASTILAGINNPGGVAVDGKGNVYVANPANGTTARDVEMLQPAAGSFGNVNLGTAAANPIELVFNFQSSGTILAPVVLTQGATGLDFTDAGTGSCTTQGTGYVYGTGSSCSVNVNFTPQHPGQRMGAVQLLNSSGDVIATAYISGFGVGPQVAFSSATTRTIATALSAPRGIATDALGNVYLANQTDSSIERLNAVGGLVPASPTTTTIGSGLAGPTGIAIDGAGNIWVSTWHQSAPTNYSIVEIESAGGTIPASPTIRTWGSGTSDFNYIQGICVDGKGNVYAADYGNNRIAELQAVNGVIPSGATAITVGGYTSFSPEGCAVDQNGNIFVADGGANQVDEMVAVGGVVPSSSPTIVTVGSGWHSPTDLAIDGSGNVYVADAQGGSHTSAIKEIVAVNGVIPGSPTINTVASGINFPYSVAVDSSGNAYYVNSDSSAYIYLSASVPPSLTFNPTLIGNTSSDSPQTVTLYNTGNATLSFPVPGTGTNPSISTGFTIAGGTCPQLTTSSLSPGTLASGSSCTEDISFQPVVSGSISGSLIHTDNALPTTQSISLSGTATGVTPTKVVLTGYTTPLAALTAEGTVTANIEDNSNAVDTNNTSSVTFTLTGPGAYSATSIVNAVAGVATGSFPAALNVAGSYSLTAASGALTPAPPQTIVVNPVAQTINFPALSNPVVNGSTGQTLAATSTSGLTVTYSIFSGPGTIVGSTLNYTGVGTIIVQADQAGDSTYAAATPVQKTVLVAAAPSAYTAPTEPAGTPSATQTATVTFTTAGTLGSINALLQGSAGLDYVVVGGGNCATGTAYVVGQACTVNYTFTPKAPGQRLGAIVLEDGSGAVLGESYLSGTGTAPLGLFTATTSLGTVSGLSLARGLSLDGTGNLYLIEAGNGNFDKIAAGTTTVTTIASYPSASLAGATAVDGAGNLFVHNGGTSIYEYVGGLGPALTIPSPCTSDDNLGVDGSGNLYLSCYGASAGAIYKLDAVTHAATLLLPSGLGHRFVGMVVDAAGDIYAADFNTNAIDFLPAGGSLSTLVSGGALNNPAGIAIDPAGNLYVVNYTGPNTVLKYAAGTYALTTLNAAGYAGIVLDPQGDIFTIADSSHVQNYTRATAAPFSYAPQAVGTTSASQTAGFENDGNATLSIASIATGTTNFNIDPSTTCGTSLVSAGTCYVAAAFTPQSVGAHTDNATFTDNTLNVPGTLQTIALSGSGLALTPATLTDPTVGVAYTTTVTANGGLAPYSYAVTLGAIPAGLTLNPNTGVLSGTPTAAGPFSFTITATDSTTPVASTVSVAYSFVSGPATVVLLPATIPDPKIGVASNQIFTASAGTAPYTYTTADPLPAGLTLNPNGTLTGTPTHAGPFSFTVTATDSSTGLNAPFSASILYNSIVDPPTIVVPLFVPQIKVGIPYSASLAAHGGTPAYTYTLAPAPGSVLPAGITLDPNTGLLSGTAITGGPYTFTVTTTDNSTGLNAPFSVTNNYAITVTPQPSAFVTPTNINFSTIPTGTTGNTWTVTLNNTTGTPMLITNWVLTDPINFSYSKTCGPILYAYQNCNILVWFTPQSTGTFNATLTEYDSSIETSHSFTLSGTSTSNLPTVQVSPTNIAFSSQAVGSTGNTSTVTVSNTSAFPLNIASIIVTDAVDFQLISTGCGPILPANSTCNLQVAFRPQSVGDFTANIVITDNATPSTIQTVTLSGTGTSNLPTVQVSPTSIAFSSVPVGVTGNAWTVTLSNTSAFPLTITSISLTDATNFVLNSGCGATLGPNSTCNMTVAFKPTYLGTFTGALNILDNATPTGLQSVTLAGTSTSNTPTVQVSPTYIGFTSEPVGVQGNAWTVTVSNTSAFPLSISSITLSDPLDFVLVNGCGLTLGANSTCNLQVSFKPASLGTFTGSLTVTDNANPSTQTVTLTGTSTSNTPTVQVSPTAINFTSEPVGVTGNAWTVTVSNTSAFPLNIASILLSDPLDFTLASGCGPILAPNSSCNLSVAFKPTTVGNINGALTITDDASPTTQVVLLNGTGTSNLPTVQVSPTAINFSSEPVGVAGNAWTVTVSNTSAFPLNIASITVSDPTDFLLGNGCGAILPAYNTCNLTLTFRPQSVGSLTATLTITDNASPGIQVVPLTGTGTSNSPVVQVSPSAVNFGSLTVGTTGNPTTLTLSNTSAFPLSIASIAVSDPADYLLTSGCGTTLGAFSTCNLTVAFRPQSVGGINATLTITDNASPSTQVVLLSGTGTALLTNVQVSPTSIAFSTQAANTTSNPVTVNFSNMGGSAVTIGSISVSDPSNFTQANSCGSTLGAFSSCSILVYFTPQAPGSYTANLVVSNNGNPTTLTVPLSGTSTGPGIGPGYSLSVNPSNVTVVAGNPATTTFTFTPVGGYVGTVAFSCSGLPAGATCAFVPPSVTADGSNTVQTSLLTITTTASGVALISENRTSPGPTLAAVFFLPALLFGSLIAWRRRSFTARVRGLLLLLLVGTAVVGGAIGCTGPVSQATPLGTHVVTVVANASVKASSGTSTTTQTASFTLTVIPK